MTDFYSQNRCVCSTRSHGPLLCAFCLSFHFKSLSDRQSDNCTGGGGGRGRCGFTFICAHAENWLAGRQGNPRHQATHQPITLQCSLWLCYF